MTQNISFDPAREVSAKFRINRRADKTFIFTEDGLDFDISGFTWQLLIKRFPGDRVNQISLTLGNGLSIPVYESNILEASFTAAQTNIEQGQYYWELLRTDIEKTWLNGWVTFSYGPQDNENETISLDIDDEGSQVTIEVTGGDGATEFIDLTDTPDSYAGSAGKVVSVKANLSGLEFTTPSTSTEHWRGAYAGASGFPTSGGTGTAGVPGAGDEYYSTNAALSINFGDGLGAVTVPVGTIFKALISTPGQTVANWKTY